MQGYYTVSRFDDDEDATFKIKAKIEAKKIADENEKIRNPPQQLLEEACKQQQNPKNLARTHHLIQLSTLYIFKGCKALDGVGVWFLVDFRLRHMYILLYPCRKDELNKKKVEYRLGAFEMEKLRKCLKNNKMRRQGCLRICQGCDKVVSSLFFL